LTYAMTVMLALGVNDLVAAQMMPVCNERLLMDNLSFVSFLFGIVGLIETGLVLYIYHQTAQCWVTALCPAWIRKFFQASVWGRRIQSRRCLEQEPVSKQELPELRNTKCLQRRMQLYREVFLLVDKGFSGFVELDEINEFGLFMRGSMWDYDAACDFMKKFDTSKDGWLDFNEFVFIC